MPLMETLYPTGGPGIQSVSFGWPGAGQADLPAGTVNVVHGGQVDEALLLPPVGSSRTLTSLPLATVWQRLQAGKIPVGVENMIAAQFPPGTGTVQSVTVAHVVSAGANKGLYLVPVYRFSGTVRFPHVAGPRRWFALAPAISR